MIPISRQRRAQIAAALVVAAATGFWLAGTDWAQRLLLAEASFDPARLELEAREAAAPISPRELRALYSGHSLSDGVPEEVARIAATRGQRFEFDVESLPGSLIAERLAQRSAGGFERRLGAYELEVVTERHDLPYTVRFERSVELLQQMLEELAAGDAGARTFFYHVWLEIDFDHPERFVSYERKALVFWECVASAVNRSLPRVEREPSVTVLPGATALAELVERLWNGVVVGAPGATPRERVQSLFRDRVHMSAAGRYFMGAVHYAVVFGASPEGAPVPTEVTPAFGVELQKIAWEHASAYAPRASAAASRDASVCRDYAAAVMCPAFDAHPRDETPDHPLRLWRRKRQCQAAFMDDGPTNPFH